MYKYFLDSIFFICTYRLRRRADASWSSPLLRAASLRGSRSTARTQRHREHVQRLLHPIRVAWYVIEAMRMLRMMAVTRNRLMILAYVRRTPGNQQQPICHTSGARWTSRTKWPTRTEVPGPRKRSSGSFFATSTTPKTKYDIIVLLRYRSSPGVTKA